MIRSLAALTAMNLPAGGQVAAPGLPQTAVEIARFGKTLTKAEITFQQYAT